MRNTLMALAAGLLLSAGAGEKRCLANPERGWRFETWIGVEAGERVDSLIVDAWPFARYAGDGVTMTQAYCYLDRYWNAEIAASKIAALERDFARARRDGVKFLLRFAYEKRIIPRETPRAEMKAPDLGRILAHIRQLTPVVRRNADVIYCLQIGWLGAWGEFHSNPLGLTSDPDSCNRVIDATLEMLPPDRSTMVRRPDVRLTYFASKGLTNELSAAEALGPSPLARLGFFNDATLADNRDASTFKHKEGAHLYAPDFARLARETAYLPVDGELFWIYPSSTRGTPVGADGYRAIERLGVHHYTTFSIVHGFSELDKARGPAGAIDAWKVTPVTPEILRAYWLPVDEDYFRGNGTATAFEYIRDHLGYRLRLRSLKADAPLAPGAEVTLSAEIANAGFARPVNPRELFFAVVSSDGRVTEVASGFDCRRFGAGESTAVMARAALPADLGAAPYRLAVWMPDASPSLRYRAAYSIEIAGARVEEIGGRRLNFPPAVPSRVPALAAAWAESEWISVKGAPVADGTAKRRQRAADGTSCFWRRIVNAKAVKSAKWMTAGLGVYELYVNGQPVGTDFLKPGYTHPEKTKRSFTYDVTALLKTGASEANDFGAEVSAGWWRDQIVLYKGVKSAFRGVLELTYADGTTERVGTKADEWFGEVAGPVTHAAIFDGEEFDARLSNAARTPPKSFAPGGCEPNGEFRGEILPTDGAEVVLRQDLAMRRGPYRVRPGEALVVDFGQNCAAVPSFRFRAKRGTVLTALPGEMLNDSDKERRGCDGPKGSVYRANLRMPEDGMRVVYTFAGDGWETYLPRFTFFGYRYLSITATDEVEIGEVASVPVSSVTKEMETGRIETGVPALNQFISNVRWGQLSNYLSVPTDCPQRNERLGWTADTQVFCEAGAYNADTRRFFRKWMRDLRDSQHGRGGFTGVAPFGQYGYEPMRIGWSDAGVIVPYTIWKMFGDRTVLEENWAAMERHVARVNETRYDFEATRPDNDGYQWADWLSYEDYESCSWRAFVETPEGKIDHLRPEAREYWNYLGACYWMMDARMMERMAQALGRDGTKYARMAAAAKAYLKQRFFATEDGLIAPTYRGKQTPALFALKLGLVEGLAREATIAALRKNIADHGNCLQTGFLGTSILQDTLVDCGLADVAYTLLLQRKDPSWLYSVDQGATTVWERWNSYTREKGFGPVCMNSFNHYAYGQVLGWIYRTVAGIAADESAPGFRNIIMKPLPDRRLVFVKAEYRSAAGLIRSAWRYEGEKWIWEFTVPPGATASVTLPGETESRVYPAGSYRVEK